MKILLAEDNEINQKVAAFMLEQAGHIVQAVANGVEALAAMSGQKFDAETWKRLLVDAFHHDTKDDPDLADDWRKVAGDMQFVPALNHPGVIVLGQQTRHFTRKLASAFIEWLYAFGAESGVAWKAHYREDA